MAKPKKYSAQSSSKLRSFLSKLNPNSPAKKLLAFVLVFAVLGGGYYAYKSMAALPPLTAGYRKVYMNGTMRNRAGNTSQVSVLKNPVSKGQFTKDGTKDIFVNSVNDAVTRRDVGIFDVGFGDTGFNYRNSSGGIQFRVCINAKDLRPFGVKGSVDIELYSSTGARPAIEITPGTAYSEKCSNWKNDYGNARDNESIGLNSVSVERGAVRIYYVKFEYKP